MTIFNRLSLFMVKFIIGLWQIALSPMIGFFTSGTGVLACRFEPSCSRYCCEAIETHGLWRGSVLTSKRLLSCRPGGKSGFDPVPDRAIASSRASSSSRIGGKINRY